MEHRYSIAQAAAETGKHYKTIALALREGRLHGTQASGKRGAWRIRESCLDAWLDHEPCPHKRNVTSIRRQSPTESRNARGQPGDSENQKGQHLV